MRQQPQLPDFIRLGGTPSTQTVRIADAATVLAFCEEPASFTTPATFPPKRQ
jgi:hypothetical protein